MSLTLKVGIESHLVEYLPFPGVLRAKLRIDNSTRTSTDAFPAGDWLEVAAVARIYDLTEIQRMGRVPDQPLAQGHEVSLRARTDWSTVDLPVPPVRPGEYGVVAKVYSHDDRYRSEFDPSNCYLSVVVFT